MKSEKEIKINLTKPSQSHEIVVGGTQVQNRTMKPVSSFFFFIWVSNSVNKQNKQIRSDLLQVRTVFLLWLPWLLRMSRPGKKITRKTIVMNSRMKELELKERSSRWERERERERHAPFFGVSAWSPSSWTRSLRFVAPLDFSTNRSKKKKAKINNMILDFPLHKKENGLQNRVDRPCCAKIAESLRWHNFDDIIFFLFFSNFNSVWSLGSGAFWPTCSTWTTIFERRPRTRAAASTTSTRPCPPHCDTPVSPPAIDTKTR